MRPRPAEPTIVPIRLVLCLGRQNHSTRRELAAMKRTTQTYCSPEFASRYINRTLTTEFGVAPYRHRFNSLLAGNTVLDLGCGSGRDMIFFRQLGRLVDGFDVSPHFVAQAATLIPDGNFFVGNFTDASGVVGNRRYHGVFCQAALLHIARCNVSLFVKTAAHLLLKGGVLYLGTKLGDTCTFDLSDADYPRLNTLLQPAELARITASAGLTVDCVLLSSLDSQPWIHLYAMALDTKS